MTERGATEVLPAETGVPTIELFWMPGCSSCLRMKEFVEKTGMPFTAVNVVEAPESRAFLRAQGVNPPAARLGDRYANGVDLRKIAELLGVEYTPPVMLAPEALVARYEVIQAALARLA